MNCERCKADDDRMVELRVDRQTFDKHGVTHFWLCKQCADDIVADIESDEFHRPEEVQA